MIRLHYCNGAVLVFNVEDWINLRKTHRIVGTLIGSTQYIQALPLKLLPEEVLLLLDENLAEVYEQNNETATKLRGNYEEFENELFEHEKIIYRNHRKRQLEAMIDDIVAAKRKRGDNRSTEEIFNEELDRSCQVTKQNMIWPILLTPLHNSGTLSYNRYLKILASPKGRIIPRSDILRNTSDIKYNIYKDLWQKGYFITTGHKFGADFLVYLGDPVAYHAIFIVRCVEEPNKSMHSTEIVAFGRLATAVKKRAVLASYQENKVSYITINWIDA